MQESDKKSAEAKNRDYKYHKKQFQTLIEEIGKFFINKEKNSNNRKKSAKIDLGNEEVEEDSILSKHIIFVPELTIPNIEIIIGLFSKNGLKEK
jgi:hypothetical protein